MVSWSILPSDSSRSNTLRRQRSWIVSVSLVQVECLNDRWFLTLVDAREKIELWRRSYHEDRPHSSAGRGEGKMNLLFAKRGIIFDVGHSLYWERP